MRNKEKKLIKDERFRIDSKELTNPKFFESFNTFVNCIFDECYMGLSGRKTSSGNQNDFDFTNKRIMFNQCSFENTNFKGMRGLMHQNFSKPKKIGLAKNLSGSIKRYFDGTSEYDNYEYYRKSNGVTNYAMKKPCLTTISDIFSSKPSPDIQKENNKNLINLDVENAIINHVKNKKKKEPNRDTDRFFKLPRATKKRKYKKSKLANIRSRAFKNISNNP